MAAEDYFDAYGDEDDERPASCKHCGKTGLHWDDDGDGKWVLLTGRYEVASVPVIIVNGTYSTSVSQAGSTDLLLTLINDLAAREKRR